VSHNTSVKNSADSRTPQERKGSTRKLGRSAPVFRIAVVCQLSLSCFLSGMMRLRHHATMTGGTTHGRLTVRCPAVPPHRVPGFNQRDARGVSAAGPALRGRVPRPDGGVADGWETADCSPVSHRQKLEFIPIKPLAAKGSSAPGSCAGHSSVPSPDHGRPASTGVSGLARCDSAWHCC
jgi:hypothetical protein